MQDIDTQSQTIELGKANPAYADKDQRTYAEGVDIHFAGLNNKTGMTTSGSPISAGCLIIDINQWNKFISHFNNADQKDNTVSITISRSMAIPTNTNVLQKAFNPQSIPSYLIQKVDAVRVALPYYH